MSCSEDHDRELDRIEQRRRCLGDDNPLCERCGEEAAHGAASDDDNAARGVHGMQSYQLWNEVLKDVNEEIV